MDIPINYEEIILVIVGISGAIISPLIIFFARLWQKQTLLEQRLESSIEIRKQIQQQMAHQQELFNPSFQQSVTDLAVIKEKVERIENRLNGWHPIHEKRDSNTENTY